MKTQMTLSVLALAIVLLGASALPSSVKHPERYSVVPGWSSGHAFTVSANTPRALLNDTGSYTDEADLELLPWDSAHVFTALAVNTCACVAMDDDVVLANGDASCGDVTDGNVTVPDASASTGAAGRCRLIVGGTSVSLRIDRAMFPQGAISATSPAGHRSSACAAPATLIGYPCDADDDCPSGGAGSCSASVAPRGVFVLFNAAASSVVAWGNDL
jgi:hypothetical protein